jgi:hypothetical protein
VFAPDFNDLLLRAADEAIPLKTDFEDMTYTDYASVWLWLSNQRPTIVRGLEEAVMIEMGFAKEFVEIITSQSGGQLSDSQIDLLEISRTSIRVQRTGQRVILLVGGSPGKATISKDGYRVITEPKGSGSIVGSWRVSSRHAVFAVLISESYKVVLPGELSVSRLEPILVLADPDVAFNPLASQLGSSLFVKVVTSTEAGPGDIASPPDIDMAVEMALKKFKTS